ncbi:MAG: metal transporter [Acidobacteria bacterium 13_1_20CM_3_53_8]|nr:MAG: metal transporter [Acidobacteria bacterium 13_1_20CM_3_53_8]
MSLILSLLGILLIVIVLWDTFETIILPRRVTRRLRLTSVLYKVAWTPWSAFARSVGNKKRREKYLGLFGPLSLLMLLMFWAVALILGYALLHWANTTGLNVPLGTASFGTYLYLSGVTFFTLGYGDVAPIGQLGRTLAVFEAATGLGLLAVVIGYLPVLYQAFSRREMNISLLDARAGSPSSATELLRRHGESGHLSDLAGLLHEWERWSAELLESHLSYPVLCFFRSQHDNQSWLSSLTTILDTCALVMVGVDGAPAWQARLTFAMSRHAVVDIAQIFNTAPSAPLSCSSRLSSEDLIRLRKILMETGVPLRDGGDADRRLAELRAMYEPYVFALSEMLLMPLPPWILGADGIDNWKTSAWGRIQ